MARGLACVPEARKMRVHASAPKAVRKIVLLPRALQPQGVADAEKNDTGAHCVSCGQQDRFSQSPPKLHNFGGLCVFWQGWLTVPATD